MHDRVTGDERFHFVEGIHSGVGMLASLVYTRQVYSGLGASRDRNTVDSGQPATASRNLPTSFVVASFVLRKASQVAHSLVNQDCLAGPEQSATLTSSSQFEQAIVGSTLTE